MVDLVVRRRGLNPQDPSTAHQRVGAEQHAPIAAALKALKGSADLTPHVARVLDQGVSETCWAHSAAALKYVFDAQRGPVHLPETPVLQSPLYFAQTLYAVYRAQQNPTGDLPDLQDTGAQLDDACRAFAQWGSQPFGTPQQSGDTDMPATQDDMGNAIAVPELEVIAVETGATVPFGGPYDVKTGSSAGDLVAASLEAGVGVWTGNLVGQAYQALGPGDVAQTCPTSDPSAGGHAQAILGYKTAPINGTLVRLYKVLNSWGKSWCMGGYCWASEDWVCNAWSLIPFTDGGAS